MTQSQRQALDNLLPHYQLPDQLLPDAANGFSSPAPLWLEIGFGNGDNLIQMAQAMPQINFIGIELYRPGVGQLINALVQHELANVRVHNGDALAWLQTCTQGPLFERILLLFPDPWPKRRHHKRRLLNAQSLSLFAERLQENGVMHFATDWEHYAQSALQLFEAHPQFANCQGSGGYAPKPDYRAPTRFERRGLQRQHRIYELLYRVDNPLAHS